MHPLQDSYQAVRNPGKSILHVLLRCHLTYASRSRCCGEHSFRFQHIRFKTDQGEIKGHVKKVRGKAVKISPHARFAITAKIQSVVTIGKEGLTFAESSRAALVLDAFKGGDLLLSSPFVRRIFFPNYSLDTLKWPQFPASKPGLNFTHRELNPSQENAVLKCLGNKKKDRDVVIIVSPSSPMSQRFVSPCVSGTSRDRKDHRDHCHSS